jgi:hypothetical protein
VRAFAVERLGDSPAILELPKPTPWFAERRITAENIASKENPLASRKGLAELARLLAR